MGLFDRRRAHRSDSARHQGNSPAGESGASDPGTLTGTAEEYHAMHLRALRDGDFRMRATAVQGLIAQGAASMPHLLRMLGRDDADSRADAAAALGSVGSSEVSVPAALLSALDRETDDEARDTILQALGDLGDPAAIPTLAELIRSRGTDGDTRHTAIESLGRIVSTDFLALPDPEAAALAWLDAQPPE